MFYINYQIVKSKADDFAGQNGFFQLEIHNNVYGEIYPPQIADKLIPDEIVYWFELLIDAAIALKENDYVALSDTESHNSWIEFVKQGANIIISLRVLEKWNGANAIEYNIADAIPGKWVNQSIPISVFEKEIIDKTNQYIQEVSSFTPNCLPIQNIKNKLALIQRTTCVVKENTDDDSNNTGE